MTAAKFAAGLASGSLAVLSEAGHNLADVATTALTYFAIRIANKPADEEHQFGHAKVEALAALVETGFLFALAVYILIEAITRLDRPRHIYRGQFFRLRCFDYLDPRGFGALAVAEADRRGDEKRRARRRRAAFFKRYRQLLPGALRDRRRTLRLSARRRPGGAWGSHFSSRWRAFSIGRRTVNTLVDAAPKGLTSHIRSIAQTVPGVVKRRDDQAASGRSRSVWRHRDHRVADFAARKSRRDRGECRGRDRGPASRSRRSRSRCSRSPSTTKLCSNAFF